MKKNQMRILAVLLVLVLAAFAGCSGEKDPNAGKQTLGADIDTLPVASGSYILTGDCCLSKTAVPENDAQITLDLNGFAVEGPAKEFYDFANATGVNLSIIDSSEAKSGKLVAYDDDIINLAEGNSLSLKNVTLDATRLADGAAIRAEGNLDIDSSTVLGAVLVGTKAKITLSGTPVLKDVQMDSAPVTIGGNGLQKGAEIIFTRSAGAGQVADGNATKEAALYFYSTGGEKVIFENNGLHIGAPFSSGLRVGYAERDYAPLCLQYKMGLAGYENDVRRITETVDPHGLDIQVLAVCDEADSVALICSMEVVTMETAYHNEVREAAAAKFGIAKERIILTSNHQHSTPNLGKNYFPASGQFNEAYKNLILDAMGAALADLESEKANAVVRTASVETDGLNYVRNTMVYGTVDNEYRGMVSTDKHIDPGVTKDYEYYFVAEEGAGDKNLQLIWFDRADMKDIILANFSTHPHSYTGGANGTIASSSFTGEFRDLISAANGDCYAMYITGASGDVNMTTTSTVIKTRVEKGSAQAVTSEQSTQTGYATKMASYVPKLDATSGLWTTQKTSQVEASAAIVTLDKNKDKADQLELAKQIAEGGEAARTTLMSSYKTYEDTEKYIYSVLHAQEIIRRSALPETIDMEVYTISIGDVAFAGAPYEMFTADGVYIKENNNHKMTVMTYLTNGHNGYIPSTKSWENGGYACDITTYAKGSADLLNNKMIELLNNMAGNE